MAGLFYEPQRPAFFTGAGGEASLGAIYAASRDAALLVDNTFAAEAAREEAYSRRNRAIFELTGEKFDNPLAISAGAKRATSAFIALPGMALAAGAASLDAEARERDWQRKVRDLAQRRPELAAQLMPGRSIDDEALEISRDAEERFTRLAGSRDGAAKWLAVLAGGMTGSARDPLQVATWAAGGGPGAARTVAGRIAMTFATEAAVNAGVELALSPVVQSYRARAGLESGAEIAIRNAAFAGLLGGVFGAAGRGVGELLARGGKSTVRAAQSASAPPALQQEIAAAAEAISPSIRQHLPLEARGAADAMELDGHTTAVKPASVSPDAHDRATATAHRILDDGDSEASFTPDAVQVSRIAAEMAGPAPTIDKPPMSLNEFIVAKGGILDVDGDFATIDPRLTRNRARRGRPDTRIPPDRMRELAEEAGYIGQAGEIQVTTVRDLADAADAETRGSKVYTREDAERVRPLADFDGEVARIEDAVSQVAKLAGPGVDDAIVRQAAEQMLRTGADAADALESVLIRSEPAQSGRIVDDIPPGWSDAELEAAAAMRPDEPHAVNGGPFDDPGNVPDAIAPPDMTGPFAPSWVAADVGGDWARALELLKKQQGGEVRGILSHPDVGPIDLPWGWYDPASGNGIGLAKIIAKHPEVVANLQDIVRGLPAVRKVQEKVVLQSDDHAAVVRLDWDRQAKTWLLTAYAWGPGEGPKSRPGGGTAERPADLGSNASSPPPAKGNVDDRADVGKPTDDALDRLMAERADREMVIATDGDPRSFADLLDELEHDEALADAIRTCPI
jgi:hypothetical protein